MSYPIKKIILSSFLSATLVAPVLSSEVTFTEIPASVVGPGNYYTTATQAYADPMAVSENGVVAFQDSDYYYKWTESGGLVQLGLKTVYTPSVDISYDGNTVLYSAGNNSALFVGNELQNINFNINPDTLSPDGTKIGGDTFETFQKAAFQSIETGEVSVVGPSNTRIKDLALDGSYILYKDYQRKHFEPSYIMTPFVGTTRIWQDFGTITDLSGDGTTVVGQYGNCGGFLCAKAWSEQNGTVELGPFIPRGTTADAGVVVGTGFKIVENQYGPYISAEGGVIWDSINGARDIVDALLMKGIDISDWTKLSLTDISDSGDYIVGYGTNPEGVVRGFMISILPQCTSAGL